MEYTSSTLPMNRSALNGERSRLGCTDRRLADLNSSVHRHGCSAGRQTRQAGRPRSPLIFRFMGSGNRTSATAEW